MALNRLLQRQVKRHLGTGPYETSVQQLLDVVSRSYDHYESDRQLLERAMDLSSNELLEVNARLRREAESLANSEQRFRLVAESLGEGIVIADLEFKITYSNTQFARLMGLTVEEVVGRDGLCFLKDDAVRNYLQRQAGRALPISLSQVESRGLRPDGTAFWTIINASPFYDEHGDLVGTLVAVTDNTRRKEHEEQILEREDRLRSLIENTEDAIWSVDQDMRLVTYNTAMVKLMRQDYGVIVRPRMHATEIHPRAELDDWIRCYERALEGERFREVTRSNGLYYELSFNPIIATSTRDASKRKKRRSDRPIITGVSVFSKDITRSKRLQDELFSAKNKAEEMHRLKSNFLANMSHEIRTPMTAILGFTDQLQELLSDQEEPAELLKIIERNATRLLQTINGILELARIESHQLEANLEEVQLGSELEKVTELLRPLARQKGLTLSLSGQSMLIRTDPLLFQQIMTNLIGNAIKFTMTGGVTVHAFSQLIGDQWHAVVEVEDTGIGISESFLPHLFEEFKQESTGYSRNFDGTGLGLTISRQLVDLIGAEISVHSIKGVGSTFTLILPLVDAEREPNYRSISATGEVSVGHAQTRPELLSRILVVEDSEDNAELLHRSLSSQYNVFIARNAVQAMELTSRINFDLILMDVNLGSGLNGLDVTRFLREQQQYIDTPIIALTAYAMKTDADRARRAGCSDYLSKPFVKKQLLDKVREALDKSKAKKLAMEAPAKAAPVSVKRSSRKIGY